MQAYRSCNVTYPAAHLVPHNGPGTKPAWPSSLSGPEWSLEPSQEQRKVGAQGEERGKKMGRGGDVQSAEEDKGVLIRRKWESLNHTLHSIFKLCI